MRAIISECTTCPGFLRASARDAARSRLHAVATFSPSVKLDHTALSQSSSSAAMILRRAFFKKQRTKKITTL
jgi:hypothetical protein